MISSIPFDEGWAFITHTNYKAIFCDLFYHLLKFEKVNKINPSDLNGIKFSYSSNNEITVSYEREKHKIDEIINKIKNSGMEIYDISTDEGNLEDVFVDLTKN